LALNALLERKIMAGKSWEYSSYRLYWVDGKLKLTKMFPAALKGRGHQLKSLSPEDWDALKEASNLPSLKGVK
jgi:hypothetical protein